MALWAHPGGARAAQPQQVLLAQQAPGAPQAKEKRPAPARLPLTGLNISGGEFGKPGGRYGFDYIYPSDTELADAKAHGFSVVRVPFLWERLQPQLDGPLAAEELVRLRDVAARAGAQGLAVILDVHNYARYFGQPIGSPQVPIEAFARFWGALAAAFRDDPRVVFGLMNEPHDMSTEVWAAAASAALAAIRATGATNLVLVSGNAYSGAHSWTQSGYGTPNAVAMAKVIDPCNNMAFEVHQYLDADFSGTSPACPSAAAALAGLRDVTTWLHEHGAKGFLGEFAASERPECLAALDSMLRFTAEHGDRWLGWTYWAGGAWWPKDYMFSVEPIAGADRPQMKVLQAWHGADGLPPASCRPRRPLGTRGTP
jgi:endoglucanase